MTWGKKVAMALGVLALWLTGTGGEAQGQAPAVLFSRGDALWQTDLRGSPPVRLGPGHDGELSPGGDRVAFTEYDEGGGRYLAVRDIARRNVWRVPGAVGANSYGPRWSPDGTTLLFNVWQEDVALWRIATVSPDGTQRRIFSGDLSGDLFSPFWGHDGREIFAQDLTFLYRFDREGRLLDKRPVDEVVGDRGISSGTRFSVAPDGASWLFDAGATASQDQALAMRVGDAVNAAFVYTVATGAVRRLTPPGLAVSSACWAPGGGVLVSAFERKDVRSASGGVRISFRLMLLSGDRRDVLVKDALAPSCAMR